MGAKNVNVGVIITQGKNGLEYALQSNLGGKDKMKFENGKKSDYWLIAFDIDDQSGLDLVFPDDISKAMWVKQLVDPADPCPAPNSYLPGVFEATKVINKNKTLVVKNYNQVVETLSFCLRFSTTPTAEPSEMFDPIVDNRNGGGGPIQDPMYLRIAGALAGGLLAVCALVGLSKARGRKRAD